MPFPLPTRQEAIPFVGFPGAWIGKGPPDQRCACDKKLKLNTDMNASNITQYFQEPTRDEIAMSAFLAWEKDGRPADRELHYWLAAEGQLRALRLKKAEAAAKAAAKTAAKTSLSKPAPLATTVKRETATVTVAKAAPTPAKRSIRPTAPAAGR
jgi:hypothetical protein